MLKKKGPTSDEKHGSSGEVRQERDNNIPDAALDFLDTQENFSKNSALELWINYTKKISKRELMKQTRDDLVDYCRDKSHFPFKEEIKC